MKVTSTILLTFSLFLSCAQSIPFVGLKGHYGSIIAHSEELVPVSQTSPLGIQGEISWLKTSDKAWKTCNCYGRTGISFAYFNYQNQRQLGSSYNLVYFAEPYLKYRGKSKLSLRAAFGVSYLDQVFDAETNPENLFFSAPLSFYLMLGLAYNYHLNDTYAINASLNYNHISNGGQKQPNKGMNFPTLAIGLDYIIDFEALSPKPDELKAYDRSLGFYAGLFSSLRSANASESSNHLRIGFLGGVVKPLAAISGITAGVEVGFDDSFRANIDERSLDESPVVSAILFGHRFLFGKVSFFTQYGVYTSRPRTLQPRSTYQSYMLNYNLTEHIGIGTGLIAYGNVADHMDFRIIWQP